MDQFAVMAKIGAPHGVKGDLKLHVFAKGGLTAFSALWIKGPGERDRWEPLKNADLFSRGGRDFIHFEGWSDRDQVRCFTHALIGVKTEDLPKEETEESFYWATLVGMTVINTHGKVLGLVDHLFETGANDVMVLKSESPEPTERLLPFVKSVVLQVDPKTRQIQVDWDEDF